MLQKLSFAVSFEDGTCQIQELPPKNLKNIPKTNKKNMFRYDRIGDRNKSIAEH
jgi:hypothetical protein